MWPRVRHEHAHAHGVVPRLAGRCRGRRARSAGGRSGGQPSGCHLNGCAARFAETQNAAAFRPQHLRPIGPLRILERMLANLQHTTMQRRSPDAVWVTRLRLRIPDISLSLRGQLAGVLGNYGHFGEAARELDVLAHQLPGDGGKQAADAAARFRARTN